MTTDAWQEKEAEGWGNLEEKMMMIDFVVVLARRICKDENKKAKMVGCEEREDAGEEERLGS